MTTTPPTFDATTPFEPTTAGPVALPASYAQELMWLVDRAAPGSSAYNVPRTRRLVGSLDVDALRRAFGTIVERHEVLRTTYAADGERVLQVIHPPRPFDMAVIDLRAVADDARAQAAISEVSSLAHRPFDLANDPLLRVTLIQLGEAEYVLHMDTHHIACDGWSRDILFRELRALYREYTGGAPANLPALAIQYGDYAVWMREQLEGARLDELLDFWRGHLEGADRVLQLPTDRPRAAVPSSASVTKRLLLSPSLAAEVRALGEQHGASLYMTLLAAIASVLHRYSGQEDVLIGSPIAGRALPETHDLIGYFANTVVQRASFAGDPSFAQLLDRVRESALGAYEHQDMPFEKLVLELQGAQQLSVSPLFQVVFTVLGGADAQEAELGDVAVLPFGASDGVTKFDLTFFMAERPDGLLLMLRGRAELFSAPKLGRMLAHVRTALEGAVRAPTTRVSALPLLDGAEVSELARIETGSVAAADDRTVLAQFEAQVRANATAMAVTDGDRGLTYGELDRRANAVAHWLIARGVHSGDRVGIGIERSVEAIVGIMGAMKVGAAYVPLPPGTPAARLARQIEDCGARVVITRCGDALELPPAVMRLDIDDVGERAESPGVALRGSDLAYVLYTSGSTGVPKGVGITHANLAHYTRAITPVLLRTAGADASSLAGWQCGVVSSVGADLGHTALFPALTSGGTVHVPSREVATEPAAFAAYVTAHALDLLKITPSHLRALVGERTGAALGAILPRCVLVTGGEALDFALARRVVDARACALLNHYGPTEATVGATTFHVTDASLTDAQACGAQTVPIGRPLPGGTAAVCEPTGTRAPLGMSGELWLAGAGVAGGGYVGDPARTTERFQTLPSIGGEAKIQRAYRTGDRVRWLTPSSEKNDVPALDAVLEFLGRTDHQVKVRGYRLELGEVESALQQHPSVRECVVVARDADGVDAAAGAVDDVRVVAYVVLARDAKAAGAAELEAWAASLLPDYAVPSVVVLDSMPLTPNGKIDRRALPDPVAPAAEASVAAPRTLTEIAIAAIWAEVLKRESVGVEDNFVALGGHSLLAIRVLGKLSRQFGIRLPLRTLFDAPTVAQLAELVDLEMQVAALEAMSDDEAAALVASKATDRS